MNLLLRAFYLSPMAYHLSESEVSAVSSDECRDPAAVAAEIDRAVRALPARNAPSIDRLRKAFSKRLEACPGAFVLDVGRALTTGYGYRSGICYELIRNHRDAFGRLGRDELEELGHGINSWGSTDSFARHLAGPAWVRGQIGLDDVTAWAGSSDRWWRRAALVATVGLNSRVSGGTGDATRTLAVCRILVDDRDDMVVKAMSWSLRELIVWEREAVVDFLDEHGERLAARVAREVRNKLETGLKNPRRSGDRRGR